MSENWYVYILGPVTMFLVSDDLWIASFHLKVLLSLLAQKNVKKKRIDGTLIHEYAALLWENNFLDNSVLAVN